MKTKIKKTFRPHPTIKVGSEVVINDQPCKVTRALLWDGRVKGRMVSFPEVRITVSSES